MMVSKSVHNPVLTELQASGQEPATEFLATLAALAFILIGIIALYVGGLLLTAEAKILVRIGWLNITPLLVGVFVLALAVISLLFSYWLLRN